MLHDYVVGRRPWGQLERILFRLPAHSHYKAALNDDDEFAEQAEKLNFPGSDKTPAVSLVGYDDAVLRLDNIYDAMNAVIEVLIAIHSKKGSTRRPNRAPRPETARQRLKRRQSMDKIAALERKLLGGEVTTA